jgi:hypothetical protein
MKAIIDVFRMNEVSKKNRAKIIINLGRLINDQYASNITEPLVYELVKILDPQNDILKNEHYLQSIKEKP